MGNKSANAKNWWTENKGILFRFLILPVLLFMVFRNWISDLYLAYVIKPLRFLFHDNCIGVIAFLTIYYCLIIPLIIKAYKKESIGTKYLCIFINAILLLGYFVVELEEYNVGDVLIYIFLALPLIVLVLQEAIAKLINNETSTSISNSQTYVIHQDTNNDDHLDRTAMIDLVYTYLIENGKLEHKKSAINIAIKGDWGIGKSYIKDKLIGKLKEYAKENEPKTPKVQVIEFKPWAGTDSENINERFIQEINNELKEKDPELSIKFNQYFNTFLNVSDNYIVNGIKVLREFLYSRISKEELTKLLEKKVIYVFIDDIDRLEKEEIRELFKFIRNNGNIPNIIYTVLFDERHVQEKLGIKNLTNYLSKFFNLEINMTSGTMDHISLFEKYLINHIESNKIRTSVDDVLRTLYSINQQKMYFLFENTRYIKSFSNRFIFSINIKKALIEEHFISIQDLFILEIIKYKFPNLYNKLKKIGYNEKIEDIISVYAEYLEKGHNKQKVAANILKGLSELLKKERKDLVIYDIPKAHINRLTNISNHAVYFNDNYNHQFNEKTIIKSLNNSKEFYTFINQHIDRIDFRAILFDHKNYSSDEERYKLIILLIEKEYLYNITKKSILVFLSHNKTFFKYVVKNMQQENSEPLDIIERKTYIIRYSFTITDAQFSKELMEKGHHFIYEKLIQIHKLKEDEINLFLKIYLRSQSNSWDNIEIKYASLRFAIRRLLDTEIHLMNNVLDFLPRKIDGISSQNSKKYSWVLNKHLVALFIDNNGELAKNISEFRKVVNKNVKTPDAIEATRDLILQSIINYINNPSNEYILLKENDMEYDNTIIQDRLLQLDHLRYKYLSDI